MTYPHLLSPILILLPGWLNFAFESNKIYFSLLREDGSERIEEGEGGASGGDQDRAREVQAFRLPRADRPIRDQDGPPERERLYELGAATQATEPILIKINPPAASQTPIRQ